MQTITEPAQIERYKALVAEMIDHYREFTEQWLTKAGWKVVPDESGGRLFYRALSRR